MNCRIANETLYYLRYIIYVILFTLYYLRTKSCSYLNNEDPRANTSGWAVGEWTKEVFVL